MDNTSKIAQMNIEQTPITVETSNSDNIPGDVRSLDGQIPKDRLSKLKRTPEEKKWSRILANRRSARKSRERKKVV